MKTGERFFILLFLVLSVVILHSSFALPSKAAFGLGPGFLPKYVSILSIIFCIVLFVLSFFRDSNPETNKKFTTKEGFIRMSMTLCLLIMSILLMNYIGMVIPLVLFLIIEFRFVEKYKMLTSIKVAVFSVAIFYAIFKIWLGVPIELI